MKKKLPQIVKLYRFEKIPKEINDIQSCLVITRWSGVHDFGPHCTRGALVVPISATRKLLYNSDHHRCTKSKNTVEATVCLQHCLICQYVVYRAY